MKVYTRSDGDGDVNRRSYTTFFHFLLQRHLDTHSDDRPFSCNQCIKSFKRQFDLTVSICVADVYLSRSRQYLSINAVELLVSK